MEFTEILALAKTVAEEYLDNKNTAPRIGLLLTEIAKLSSNRLTGYTYLGPAEISANPPMFGQNDRFYYSMLVPKEVTDLPNFDIHEITLSSDTIFLLTWNGDSWSVSVFPLPAGSSVADGSVTPGKIASQTLEQGIDWNLAFEKEGHWVVVDDVLAENRPDNLPVPTGVQQNIYECHVFGKHSDGAVSIMAYDQNWDVWYGKKEAGSTAGLVCITKDIRDTYNNIYASTVRKFLFAEVTLEMVDAFVFKSSEYSVFMAEDLLLNGFKYFVIKVYDPTGGDIIQHQITPENVIFSRRYSMMLSAWTEWVCISEDINNRLAVGTLQEVLDSEIDSFLSKGEYSINMAAGQTYVPSEFTLKVFIDGEGNIIQHRITSENKIYSRSYTTEWSPWKLISNDLSLYAAASSVSDIAVGLANIQIILNSING